MLAAIAGLVPACGPSSASLAVAVTPNPIPVSLFNFGHGRIVYRADWSVRVTETAGVAGRIEGLDTLVREAGTGRSVEQVFTDEYEAPLEAFGSRALTQRWLADREPLARLAFSVTVSFRDAKGHLLHQSLEVPEVVPRPADLISP